MFDIECLYAISFFIAFTMTGIIAYLLCNEKTRKTFPPSKKSKERNIRHAFKVLGYKDLKWKKSRSGCTANFTYQNVDFEIKIDDKSPFAWMSIRNLYSTSLCNLETLRMMCNICNSNTNICTIIYNVDSDQGKINVDIRAGIVTVSRDTDSIMYFVIKEMYNWREAFIRQIDEIIKDCDKLHTKDFEKENAKAEHELTIICKQEQSHSRLKDYRNKFHTEKINAILWSTILPDNDATPLSMTVMSEKQPTLFVPIENIDSFDLSQLVIKDGKFFDNNVTAILTLTENKQSQRHKIYSINLRQEKENQTTLYYRTTITKMPDHAGCDRSSHRTSEASPSVRSLLFGYNRETKDQHNAEFRYMLHDAEVKHTKGEVEEMTQSQKLVCGFDEHLGYDIYWGTTLFSQERYTEALPYLVSAFETMKRRSDNNDERFFEICYLTGFCYCEQEQYDRAYYYLELTLHLHHINYTEEYINCLVNSEDPRAEDVINSLLADLTLLKSENKGRIHSGIDKFVNFLRRRKAYIFVSARKYKEAEHLLKNMLDEPDNCDFAINELAFIQQQQRLNTVRAAT